METLFAIASKGGKIIDQHFGHAERFLIYKATSDTSISFVEERSVSRYCLPDDEENHLFMEERLESVVNIIKDCHFLLVSRIGVMPEDKIIKMGITPVMIYDRINDGIRKILEDNHVFK